MYSRHEKKSFRVSVKKQNKKKHVEKLIAKEKKLH